MQDMEKNISLGSEIIDFDNITSKADSLESYEIEKFERFIEQKIERAVDQLNVYKKTLDLLYEFKTERQDELNKFLFDNSDIELCQN